MSDVTCEPGVIARLEALERRVQELEARTWMLQPVGGLSSPTVDFGTVRILEEQIAKDREARRLTDNRAAELILNMEKPA